MAKQAKLKVGNTRLPAPPPGTPDNAPPDGPKQDYILSVAPPTKMWSGTASDARVKSERQRLKGARLKVNRATKGK